MQVESGEHGDCKGARDITNMAFIKAEAAVVAIALARTKVQEGVEWNDEEAGGTGMMKDQNRSQEFRAMLQKLVLEHGVGSWEEKVRMHLKLHRALICRRSVGVDRAHFFMSVKCMRPSLSWLVKQLWWLLFTYCRAGRDTLLLNCTSLESETRTLCT